MNADILNMLKRLAVENRSTACVGCGYEHNCGIHGCTVIKTAIQRIEKPEKVAIAQINFDAEQMEEIVKDAIDDFMCNLITAHCSSCGYDHQIIWDVEEFGYHPHCPGCGALLTIGDDEI